MPQLSRAREIDWKCLRLLMQRSTGGSRLKKDKAVKHLDRAYKRGELFIPSNEDEKQKWWRCEARMLLGDFSDWSGWEYRDEWAKTLWFTNPFDRPVWDKKEVGTLYIIGEQGVGDEVFFSSCIPDVKKLSKRVILETTDRLRPIFERSFNIETVSAKIEGTKRFKQDLPDCDAWIALGDLPRIFRKNGGFTDKWIKPDPIRVEEFKKYKGRVGLSWRGAQGSCDELMDLHKDAVSLQYGQGWDEDIEIPDLDLRDDLEGVLGLLSNLSKLVTVSTSVAHFSCSMGIETHVILADPSTSRRGNILPWRWGLGGKTPWYKSAFIKNFNHFLNATKPRFKFFYICIH